ncbi:YopT-type cysteine protease domain-containing protein [[Haemophilus] ducreyi]
MNNKRYKLIFSKVKNCLVPVAENIKSASGNSGSSSNSKIAEDQEEEPDSLACSLSPLSSSIHLGLHNHSPLKVFKGKNLSVVLLSLMPAMQVWADSSNAIVDHSHGAKQTAVDERDPKNGKEKVVVINIAKPDEQGISDNHFSKFNIPNSAVFNNSIKEGNSQLVGLLGENKNLGSQAAKTIFNQVTGDQESKISGGLEVFGEKADLFIINPNGVTLNGVKTINTDRFVASTSEVVEPHIKQLNVQRGKVIIGKDGVATNGLSHFDVVAKNIEQQGKVSIEGDSKPAKLANVTFAAGNLTYDVNTRDVNRNTNPKKPITDNTRKDNIAISGESAGSMYGRNIKFIVTDKGAGVNHQGVIFAEDDINILTDDGNSRLNKVYADYVRVVGKDIELANNGQIHADQQLILNATGHVKLNDGSSVISNNNLGISALNLTLENATVSANNLSFRVTNDTKLNNLSKVSARAADLQSGNLNLDKASVLAHKLTLNISNDVSLNNQSKLSANNLKIKKVRDLNLNNSELSANNLTLNTSNNITLKNKSKFTAGNMTLNVTNNVTLNNDSELAANNLTLNVTKNVTLNDASKLSANKLDLNVTDNVTLNSKSTLSAGELTFKKVKNVTLNNDSELAANNLSLNASHNVTLNNKSKLSAQKADIKAVNLTLNDTTELTAKNLDINSTTITNNGTIAGIFANITTEKLNNKEKALILAEQNLNFTVNGSHYENKGDIVSKDKATVTFSKNSDFTSNGSKLVNAQNQLKVNVNNFTISQGDDITLIGNVTLNASGTFTNSGNLTTVKTLDVGDIQNFTNKGNLTVGEDLHIKSKTKITNDGKLISIKNLNISSEADFINNGTLLGIEALKIATKGNFTNKEKAILASNSLLDISVAEGKKTFNNGTIESGKNLNITNTGAFLNVDNATIRSFGVLNITSTGNVSNNGTLISNERLNITSAANFTNESNGTVMSNGLLNIIAKQGNITNKNLIASRQQLNLTAVADNITNDSNISNKIAVLHSLGNISLNSKDQVYNLGEIYAGNNISVKAHQLKNDVKLMGDITTKTKEGQASYKLYQASNGGHFGNDGSSGYSEGDLNIKGKFADLDNKLTVQRIGKIYAGRDLTFNKSNAGGKSEIINRGTINVKNKLSYDSDVSFENNMQSQKVDLYTKIFEAKSDIELTFKTNGTHPVYLNFKSNNNEKKYRNSENTKNFKSIGDLINEALSDSAPEAIEAYYSGSSSNCINPVSYLAALGNANNSSNPHYLNTALKHILGNGWQDDLKKQENIKVLKQKWEDFKKDKGASKMLDLYPNTDKEKAKIFAGIIRNGNDTISDVESEDFKKKYSKFQNGEWAKNDTGTDSYDSTKASEKYKKVENVDHKENIDEHKLNIGKHEITVPGVSFENLNNKNMDHQPDKLGEIDKSIISELLAQPVYTEKSAARDSDPRVNQNDKEALDNLYRTRLSYINQNNYLGAKYFFNQLDTEDDKLKGIKRIGDNYFEYQLITRLIEKVADNHLTLKHGLHDIALVKKLIDSASIQAKDLNLKVGEALTKEQKDNLKEDIVWYVKTEVNGQEVLVPQVYLAKQTIEEVEKQRGVGTGQIRAGIIDVKVDDVRNTGTIAGYAVGLEAKNKLKNTGDILSQRLSKLVGKKGLESTGVTYVDETGATKVRKARIKSEGHIYLETDKDKNVDLTASELKGSTGQIKAKDLNLNDIYETSYKYKYEKLFGKNGGEIGDRVTQTSQAKSVGTDASFDHLHLSLEGDVNQTGSNLKANRTTGVVKGDFNTKAGKDLFHRQIDTVTSGTVYSASASGGGQSAGISLTDQGVETYTNKTATAGANADVTNFMKRTRETETSLTHRNSEFNALSGELYVMGKADIGGVDINRDVEVIKTPEEIAAEQKAAEEAKKAEVKENEASETAAKETEEAENDNVAEKDKTKPKFKKLTDEEIAAAFETKGEDFFAAYKAREEEDRKKGFTLSAEQIESTKARDEKETTYYELKVGVGAEAEAHSAAADAISNKARQIIDTQNGLKQDGTVALQEASDVLNLATGDLAGASAKLKFELSTIEKKSRGASDGRSILGGRLNLAARGGDITLNNVETTENSHLSLKARDNVNVNSGVTEQKDESNSQSLKVTAGASSGCGVMAGGCSAGVSAGVSGSYNESNTESTSHTNSLLRGKSLRVEAGKDFNLISSNVDVDHLHLDVKGDTNVVSKQDSYSRKERGVNYSVSAGVGVSTAGGARPNGSVGLGVSAENENSKIVKQQAGISAKRITGEINNLNLTGGYIENKGNPDELNVKGDITTHELKDEHHKDGGSFGGSVGVSETGVTQVNVNGGRVEQKHYEATQHSSISGINTKGKTVGNFKTDRSQSTEVHRDDTIAATNFNFELGDIAELAKKGKEKWDNRSAKTTSSSQDSAHDPRSRSVENGYSELPRFKTADNDAGVDSPRLIKGEAEQAQTLALTKAGNDVIPEVQSLTQKARPQSLVDESPYAEIPALTRPQVKSNIAESIEVPQFRTKVSDGDEGNYAEITFPTNKAAISSTQDVGDTPTPRALRLESESGYESAENLGLIPRGFKSSPKGEYEDISDAIEPQTRSRKLDEPEPIYGTINKSPEAIARANAKADEAIQALGYDPRIKPVVPEEAPPALPPRNLQTKAISDYDDVSYVPDFKVRKTDEPEPIYGTINKSPEAIARANAKADEAIQASGYDPRIKPVVPEDAPPALPPRTQSLIDSTEVPSYRSALANVKFDDASPWPQPSALRSKAFADEPSSETPKSRGKRGISEESLSSTVQPRSRKISEEDSSFERLPLRIIDNGSDYAEILPRNVKQTNEPATQAIRAPKALDNNDVIAERPSFKLRQLDDDVESVNGIYSSIKPKALIEEGTPITRQVKTVQEETPVTDLVNKRELVKEDRSLLDKVQDTFQPLKVRSKINDVRSSVEEYGGEVTFKYAQSKGEVYNEIVKHAETQNGVCEATCSHWIAKKVNDENIWTDLYKDGQKGRKGGLNKDAIESIEKLQTEFINAGTATQQFKLTNTWLEEQGVVPKQKYFGKLSRADEVAGTVSKNDVSALVKAILDTGNESSAVKKISINLEGGSHTVSASIEGQKVVFFDPNFGEITFKDKKSFEKWMKNAFWKKSGYAGKKDTKRFFNVVNYHKNSKRNKVIDVNQNHIQQLAGSEGFSPSLPTRPQLANAAGIKSNEMSSLFSWSKLKHLFSRESGKKAQVEGPEIKHLGGVVDKDAFYFPLDKIVTRRDAEGEIRVNMDNIKKAFNPRDKHYNSQEARSLRSLYNQDPSMSGTRFIIENQVIANPFSSADLQSYIQAQQSKLPELGRQARRALPELPTAANKGRGSRVEEQNIVTRPRVEDVYATVNKGAKHGEAQQPGSFYTKKLVDQVSHVPTTEPVYADLHFNRNGRVVRQTEPEVIYEKIRGQQVEVDDPSSLYAKVNRNRRLDNVEGFYPPEQLRTRSDKLAEQVSRVPTTEPVYADLRFKSAEDDYAPALPARPELGNAAGFRKAKVKGEESESTWSRLKHLFSRESGKKAQVEGPEIKHLGGVVDKDAFYFPLDKIVTRRDAEGEIRVNMDNIKKAFNPRDKHYNSQEARSLRSLYNQDPSMSGTRFIIENQVIANPFSSADLQSYIQAQQSKLPELGRQARRALPELPTAANKGRGSRVEEQNIVTRPRVEDVYATVNKGAKHGEAQQPGSFYTKKLVDQVSHVPTTEPVYADLHFNRNGRVVRQTEPEVIYEKIRGQQVEVDDPSSLYAKVNRNRRLDNVEGFYPPEQLRTRSDKLAEQVSRVPTTEPVYADLRFKSAEDDYAPALPARPELGNAAGFRKAKVKGEESESTWSRLKHLFSRESGKKAQVEGPEIKHLGGVVDKDAFYFPLDKIVTRRDAEGEIRVNMDNIKKAFNPRDKHYNSQEARSLRSLYNQDPSMSGTRFIIENQVIANPFSSADLQSYIQAQQSKLPELGRQARRALPELPTAANKGRGSRVEEQNIVTRPRVEDVYATVNKGAKHGEAQQPGSFYTKKLVDQVSHVPTTEPVYADLHFNRNGRVVRQTEPEVIYEKIRGQQVEVDDPSSLYAKVNRNRRLDNVEGFYPPEQLRTRSDKLAEQVSRVPTTEPVYADLRFKSAEDDYAPALPARPELGNAAGFRKAKVKGEESESTWSRLKHLFSRESGKKAQVEGPEIKHLGGVVDKDAFYFPLDKIVTRRDAEGEIRVNMDNIKKAFNPRDKHYNSQEARSLRSLYNQDPSMSGTRFIIENQVIANPFSSADLQSYIQAQQSKLPELGRQARRALPELPTAANKGRGSRVEEQNIVTRPRVEDVYATVNKGAKHGEAQQPGSFYTKKLVDQVSHVPTTEPVYADLHFNRNGRVVRQTEPEVIYEKIRGQQVEVDDPSSLYAKVNRNRRLDNVEGFYPPEQLRTRSDKLAEQVSRVPTTEPVYADLRFKSAEDDYAPALPARPELGNAAGFRKAKVKGEESESTWSRLKHLFSRESGKTKVEEVENEYKSQTNGENSLEIKTIEHIPTRLKNLESPREAQSDLGENALIYGLQRGRQALISKANAADKEGKNAILADSYIGKLNLGFEFGELTKFAKQVKDGKVTEQDIQNIASFNDETAKLARRSEPKNRINDANVDDNQRIIRELINNEAAVDALKRIATLSDQEKAMHSTLRANEKFDMDELEESPNYTTAENKSIRDYKDTQKALNDARMDFFTEKTKFIAKETLERGGQLYFALDGLVTNSPGFRADTQINMDKLKDVFNPNHEHYDSVTSRELRYLYENYKDNPNLKFTLKDHVIANPLKTLKTSISESDLKSSPRRARQEGPSLLQRVRNLFDKSSSNKRSEKDTAQTSVGYRNTNIDIINDKTKGVNHIVENGVEVALTNTDYKPLKLPNVEAAFKQTKLKAENIDPHIEAVKKLEIIASSANSIPKEHLLKALIEVTEGKTDEDINVYQKLFNTRQNISNEVAPTYSLRNLDGKDGKQILRSVAEIYKNLPLSDTYQAVRNYVNNRLIEKLSSNRLLLEHLANSKISGNEYAIKYIFDTVSRAKQEIFEQELNTELAPVSLDIMRRKAANILSSEHGSYKDGTLSIYDKPVKSAFHSRLKNNGEVLNTIVHELTHHEQDALAKIIDNKGYDAKLFDKNNILYITGGLGYPKQALERDAFLSGDSVSEAFMKKAKEYHERTKQERKDAKKDEARIAKLYKQWEQEEANKKSASLNGSSQSLDSRSEVEFNRVSHKSVR